MVFEALTSPKGAEQHPLRLFFIGFIYAIIAVVFSLWIFREYSSLIMVFLTVVVTIPLMYSTFIYEEKRDFTEDTEELGLLEEHGKAISFLTFLFLGILVAFSLCYIFLPFDLVNMMFDAQIATIKSINADASSIHYGYTVFLDIFFNNIRVLLFCLLFSFFYGAGAIFILTWNASVISVAIGSFVRNRLADFVSASFPGVFGYFHLFSIGIMRYMTHGVFEIVAYFIGALGGGILSAAIINKDIETNKFNKIMIDVVTLVLVAIVILIFAAFIEVYITPILF